MCNAQCIAFGNKWILEEEVRGKSVLEVGSKNLNGSLRTIAVNFGSASYIGVDIEAGEGVDEICSTYNLVDKYGENKFDFVISTEMLEHVCDWRRAISNLKRVVKSGGFILITTRSKGFGYHAYPTDHWRYETEDMQKIFADCEIIAIEKDANDQPGVFIKVKKPGFQELNTDDIHLYHISEP